MISGKRNLKDCPQKKNDLEKKGSLLRKNVQEINIYDLSGKTNGGLDTKSGSKHLCLDLGDKLVEEIRYHQDSGSPGEVGFDTMHSLGEKKAELINREPVENLEVPSRLVKKRNAKVEALELVSDGTAVHSSKRHCLEVLNIGENFESSQLKEKSRTRRNSRMISEKRNLDDCPQKKNDLKKKSSLLNDGKGLVFTSRSCGLFRFDEESSSESDEESSLESDEESSSYSDVHILDRDPHELYGTPIMMDVDSCRSSESHFLFKQGIMQDLQRPYNSEEYISLLEN